MHTARYIQLDYKSTRWNKLHRNVQINSSGLWDRVVELDCNLEQTPRGGWEQITSVLINHTRFPNEHIHSQRTAFHNLTKLLNMDMRKPISLTLLCTCVWEQEYQRGSLTSKPTVTLSKHEAHLCLPTDNAPTSPQLNHIFKHFFKIFWEAKHRRLN